MKWPLVWKSTMEYEVMKWRVRYEHSLLTLRKQSKAKVILTVSQFQSLSPYGKGFAVGLLGGLRIQTGVPVNYLPIDHEDIEQFESGKWDAEIHRKSSFLAMQ